MTRVEGRSRNRRVDLYFSRGNDTEDIDLPSLCALAPALCLCFVNPAICREQDHDGIEWPTLCHGVLGALLCGAIICALAPEFCLLALCAAFPPLCLATLCLLVPWLCRRKPKPPEKDKKQKRACPPANVVLPSGPIQANKLEKIGKAELWYLFDMIIDFNAAVPECKCECGEYEQLI